MLVSMCVVAVVASIAMPLPCRCSVYMRREEECVGSGSSSGKCSSSVFHPPAYVSLQRINVLGVEQPQAATKRNSSRNYTPLPFAAFLRPMPVYQASEETVFNVLERERTIDRLLKGGKRQKDREVKSDDGDEATLSESENTSNSNVKFRRRKGGKRSDRKRQLRRERIERKRTRRKNKRKSRREKKRKNNHPKQRQGKKRKLKRGKLRSLNTRKRKRNRKEQVGINPTIFVEDTHNEKEVSSAGVTRVNAIQMDEQHGGSTRHQTVLVDPKHFLMSRNSGDSGNLKTGEVSINLNVPEAITGTASRTTNIPKSNTDISEFLNNLSGSTRDISEKLIIPTSASLPFIDVHNYRVGGTDMNDYDSDEDDLTDVEYSSQALDDYQIAPDYFNWKDNSSIDYFTQGEDTTISPESWRSNSALDALQLDPSHIQIRRHLVRLHNLLRSKVDPPASNMLALSWHGAAATHARQWAESCVSHRGRDHPSVRWTPRYGACGQNVLVTRRKRRWAQVIRSWWNERRVFEFGSTEMRNATYKARSYTQLVWYSSHKVGCGYSQCTTTSGRTFHRYVCNYCPAGNDPSRLSLPYTKGRPCEMCPKACRSVCPEGQCRLCTNRCSFSDLWANCSTLAQRWRQWLCNTKTQLGVERFKNCRATCQCALAGDKII